MVAPATYLSLLEKPGQRTAFSLARWKALPSAVVEGRFRKTPMLERVCPCGDGEVETIKHVLLYCQFYQEIRSKIIFPLLRRYTGRSDIELFNLFLIGANPKITVPCAKFFSAAYKIHQEILRSIL